MTLIFFNFSREFTFSSLQRNIIAAFCACDYYCGNVCMCVCVCVCMYVCMYASISAIILEKPVNKKITDACHKNSSPKHYIHGYNPPGGPPGPSLLLFEIAVSFIPSSDVWSGYFNVSLNLVIVPTVWILINLTQLHFDTCDTASLRRFSIDCSDFISRYCLPFGWSINDSSSLEPCKIKSSKKVSFVAPQNVQNNARHLYREM